MKKITAQPSTLISLDVAKMVGKRHDHLIRDIVNYISHIEESNAPKIGVSRAGFISSDEKTTAPKIGVSEFFIESTYTDSTGRTLPCYEITKKGCEFIANKLTGQKGTFFTATYINRFHDMDERLRESSQDLKQTRLENKSNRLKECAEIKMLEEYATAHGSTNANRYYIHYTELVNKAVGIPSKQRNRITTQVLTAITFLENMIRGTIKEEIAKCTEYHEIYRICKTKVNEAVKFLYLPAQKLLVG